MKIVFLGEKNRADAITWYSGIEGSSKLEINKYEIPLTRNRWMRFISALFFYMNLLIKTADISLAERATSYGLAALFLRSKLKVVAQQGITDAYPEHGINGLFKRILQKLVYQESDIVHAWGTIMIPAQLRSGCHPSKIITLPKGLPLKEYIFANTQIQDSLGKPFLRIVVTRSLNPEYNHLNLLEAIKILVYDKGFQSVHLTVVGDGILINNLIELTNSLKIQRFVTFLGRVEYNELPRILSMHNVYISVPLTEGFSASLQEAMAIGLFPILSNIPGNRALINPNKNGFLVNPLDPQDIANKILKINGLPWKSDAIFENRNWIDKYGNKENNMVFFWDEYLSQYKSKCVE
jgi:glycosyltransferase involved in cell wall biosynthesis